MNRPMNIDFTQIYLTRLEKSTPGIMPSISLKQLINLGCPGAIAKKLSIVIPEPFHDAKAELQKLKRNHQNWTSLSGGGDWLILLKEFKSSFVEDYQILEKEAQAIIQDLIDIYPHIKKDFTQTCNHQLIKLGLDDKESNRMGKAITAEFFPKLDDIQQWGFELFYPLNCQQYLNLTNPVQATKYLEFVFRPAITSLESTVLELAGDYLKMVDDIARPPVAIDARDSLTSITFGRLENMGKYVECFQNEVNPDLYNLVMGCLHDSAKPLDRDKTRRTWSQIFINNGINSLADRNLTHWILAGEKTADKIPPSPKSPSYRKFWDDSVNLKNVQKLLAMYL